MCAKPFSQTKNKGKLFLVAKSSGPLLARMPLNFSVRALSTNSLVQVVMPVTSVKLAVIFHRAFVSI